MQKKILILGGAGLLGINWSLLMEKRYQVYRTFHNSKPPIGVSTDIKIDVTKTAPVRRGGNCG